MRRNFREGAMEEEPSKTLEFGSGLWVEMILKITAKPDMTIIRVC